MAHIAVFVGAINRQGSQLRLSGFASISGSDDVIYWQADVAWTALSATMNEAARDAAIAAADVAGHTVGPLDNKTLFCGAMGV